MIRRRSKAIPSQVKPKSGESPAAHPVENGTLDNNVGHADEDLRIVTNRLKNGDAIYDAIVKAAEAKQREQESMQKLRDQADQTSAAKPANSSENVGSPKESGTYGSNVRHSASPAQTSATTPPTSESATRANESTTAQNSEPSPTFEDLAPRLEHEKKSVAVRALLRGATNTTAAKEAGVDRRTVFRWRQEEEFQSELHRLQSCFCGMLRTSAAELVDDSVEVIREAVDQGKITTALELVQALKILGGQSLAEIDGLDAANKLDTAIVFPAPVPPVPIQPEAATIGDFLKSTPNVQFVSATAASVNSQIPAEPIDLEDLPYNQRLAIVKLISGKCVAEVAKDMDVSIFTIEHWMRNDEAFRQVLRRCRQEQMQRLQCKLLRISSHALAVLKCALKHNRDVRVAFAILRGLKIAGHA